MDEISAARHRSRTWADDRIRALYKEGRIGVGFRQGFDRIGRPTQTPVYWRDRQDGMILE